MRLKIMQVMLFPACPPEKVRAALIAPPYSCIYTISRPPGVHMARCVIARAGSQGRVTILLAQGVRASHQTVVRLQE